MKSEATHAQELFSRFENKDGFNRENAEYESVKDPDISRLLASKSGNGKGKPELTYRLGPKDVLVWEIKPNLTDFSSQGPNGAPIGFLEVPLPKAKEKAEDGVVHYMRGLSREFNVIGVAAAPAGGKSWQISTFRVREGGRIEKVDANKILSPGEYQELIDATYTTKETPAEIQEFSEWLHNHLRSKMKLSEADKPLLVSGILVALEDDIFCRTFREHSEDTIQEATLAAIKNVLEEKTNKLRSKKRGQVQKLDVMMACYQSVINKLATKSGLQRVITDIKRNLHNLDHHKQTFDLLGHFYGEFLKYSGGDKKGLGIVLTPNHITSLFAKLADLRFGDCALDTCTGTAGFLIAAMAQMTARYETEPEKLDKILKDAFLGIEFNENNYTLACANMLLRGDGKSNIKYGNCFDSAFDEIKSPSFGRPKATFLNPPYSQDKDESTKGEHELDFVARACDLTGKAGSVIAIVPMSCVCEQNKESVAKRGMLLKNNTLTAVMSMPDGLFAKTGTVTCVIVLTAGVPHHQRTSTWFAYWKDDGFKLKKGTRYETTPWWDLEQKSEEEIDQISDPAKQKALKECRGWVYPAHTWQPLQNMEWAKGKKVRDRETGKNLVYGRETQWAQDFKDKKERPQYSVQVNLSEKAEELQRQAIEDETEDMIQAGMSPEAAKARAAEKNLHWTPEYIEWCAEAYLETDYSLLTKEVFETTLREYAIHLLRQS